MKVQHDTGWNSLIINKTSSEKPVDKIEETNQEFSQYPISSTLTDIWTAEDSRERSNPQKPKTRHRFPPSLLSSRTVDFWNTLMPLRANCSCSSVSIGDKCSRSSSGVSSSAATFDSNLEISVPCFKETAVGETLGDTLEHTHLAFKLLIGRMVRLLNVLKKKSDSSLSQVCSDSNLKILPLSDNKLKESVELIGKVSDSKFPSITSISSNSTNLWSTGRTGKKSESSTTLEIAGQKRRGKGLLSHKSIVPRSLRVTKSVLTLTNEELVYLLQYKNSLLSEYFQCNEVESMDLKEKLAASERNGSVYGSQSDSGLQEHDLLEFVQFIRARKKKDAEDIIKINIQSLAEQRPETRSESICNEESRQLSTPKRRVTFSDPITDESTTVLDCDSTDSEDRILSTQNSANAIINDTDIECGKFIQSDDFHDSKPSKTCFDDLSLDPLSTKAYDEMLASCYGTPDTDMTEKEPEEKLETASLMEIEKLQLFANENCLNESWSTARPTSLQKGRKAGSTIDAEKIEEEMLIGLKFLVKETVDFGTTHVPMADEVFKECSGQKSSEKSSKRKIRSVGFGESPGSIDYEHQTLYCDLRSESNRSKINGCCNANRSKIPVKCDQRKITWNSSENQHLTDTAVAEDCPSVSSGKTVTFQDFRQSISDQSIVCDQKELEPTDDKLVPSSESIGRFELTWKGCWDQQSTPRVVQSTEKLEDNFTEDEGRSFESGPMVVPNGSGEFTSIDSYKEESDLVSRLEKDVQSANDRRSKHRNRSVKAFPPSSFPYSSDSSVFREKDETIHPNEDPSESCNPGSEFNSGNEADSKSIEFRNLTESSKKFDNIFAQIKNPEIWRAEMRSAQTKAFCKYDWYARPDSDRYPWKIPEVGSDWLIRKLEELQSRPGTDYESDYYAESEMSDFEFGRDLALVKRSFSNLNMHLKNCKRSKAKRRRFDRNSFLDKVWFGARDIRHTSFQDSDQRSNQSVFSHLRHRLILDSETEDSDFPPSIQPDFYNDADRREEHVNKIKCRRFVRSLKNVKSEGDRQFSSTGLLHVTFKKSFTPASVQCAFSTRTLGTNVSANTISSPAMDVSIDTYDLCPRKPIETTIRSSESMFSKDTISCQTVEKALKKSHALLGSNLQVPKTREQKLSTAIENLSTQINDASNNLAKLRFSEIKAQPDFGADSSLSKSGNLQTNSDCCAVNQSGCPICNVDQKPTPRYILPACIVKGADPGSKANEKDPWNRVMERAKAQHRYEGQNKSNSLEMKPSTKSSRVSSTPTPLHELNYLQKTDYRTVNGGDHFCKEEVRIELVQVKINSSQSGKIHSTPTRKDRQRILQPLAAVSFPTSSNADFSTSSLLSTRSPER